MCARGVHGGVSCAAVYRGGPFPPGRPYRRSRATAAGRVPCHAFLSGLRRRRRSDQNRLVAAAPPVGRGGTVEFAASGVVASTGAGSDLVAVVVFQRCAASWASAWERQMPVWGMSGRHGWTSVLRTVGLYTPRARKETRSRRRTTIRTRSLRWPRWRPTINTFSPPSPHCGGSTQTFVPAEKCRVPPERCARSSPGAAPATFATTHQPSSSPRSTTAIINCPTGTCTGFRCAAAAVTEPATPRPSTAACPAAPVDHGPVRPQSLGEVPAVDHQLVGGFAGDDQGGFECWRQPAVRFAHPTTATAASRRRLRYSLGGTFRRAG
ncbi:MAG: hypothetical protein V7637_5330 [Mycobacteriales bacterium]